MAEFQEPETSLETPNIIPTSGVGPIAQSNDSLTGAVPPTPAVTSSPPPSNPSPQPPRKPPFLNRLVARFNPYAMLFVLLLLVAAGVILLSVRAGNNNNGSNANKKTSSLTDADISTLKGSTTVVGSNKQTLDVQSDSIFEGQILARSNLDVAGSLKVGKGLSLPNLNVAGQSSVAGLQVGQDLKVAGAADIQGQLTLHKGLSVAGATSFGSLSASSLSVTSLQLTGDLGLSRHVVTSGNSTSKTNGTALGSGGTASVSGNDTAGTINVNTGSGPAAGLFITVKFAHSFSATPHVLITPVGSATGSLAYYVTRTTSGFSLGVSSAPAAGKNYVFDYLVIQ